MTFLDRYVSDELSAAEKRAFEAHLSECPSCVNYLRNYRRVMMLVVDAHASGDEIPADLPEDLVRAIIAARGGESS